MSVVMDARSLLEGIDDVPVDGGNVGGGLPKGTYPGTVDRIVTKEFSKNNVPRVAFMIKISEGELKGRTAFLDIYLGASRFDTKYENGKKVGDTERSEQDYNEKRLAALGRVKGLLTALDLPHKNVPSVGPDDSEYIFEYFGIDNMVGRGAMWTLSIDGEGRNKLQGVRSFSHAKEGLDAWRDKQARKGGVTL